MSDGHGHAEIVIIRRGGHGDHDEHNGGVWKIAFADFMTAMMAFFLVLWLVSANDKTKASVARYFNPVKLVDATTQPRGLSDPKPDDPGNTASPSNKNAKPNKESTLQNSPKSTPSHETSAGKEARLDSELQNNPYFALAEIVGDKGLGEPNLKNPAAEKPAIGHGGTAFRDPFAPPPPGTADIEDDAPRGDLPPVAGPTPNAPPKPLPQAEIKADAVPPSSPQLSDLALKQTVELKTKISEAMKSLGSSLNEPSVDVRKTGEGTLVSLTDTANFTMFSNGSAVPDRRVILMMAKIAELVKDKPGQIVIRGFTDNKKFKSGRYDNWHLSLDRAQVAHYMLVRGGLSDDRISHVEGYADHDNSATFDAGDPRSRRIELLVLDAPK